MKNFLKIPENEWASALTYFSTPSAQAKYRRKDSNLSHSFIKVDGELYAMAHLHLPIEKSAFLGAGSFAKIKIIQNKEGKNYALRVEKFSEDKSLSLSNDSILKKLNRFFGSLLRRSKNGIHKKYTVEELIEGKQLYGEICRDHYTDIVERLIISYKILKEAEDLHFQNILHCDLTDTNIIIRGIESDIIIKIVDFNLSIKVDNINDLIERSEIVGTPGFIAPETERDAEYSTASEVYALGSILYHPDINEDEQIMPGLLYDYKISSTLLSALKRMHHHAPEKRPTIPVLANLILEELIILYKKSCETYSTDYRIFDFMKKIQKEAPPPLIQTLHLPTAHSELLPLSPISSLTSSLSFSPPPPFLKSCLKSTADISHDPSHLQKPRVQFTV